MGLFKERDVEVVGWVFLVCDFEYLLNWNVNMLFGGELVCVYFVWVFVVEVLFLIVDEFVVVLDFWY